MILQLQFHSTIFARAVLGPNFGKDQVRLQLVFSIFEYDDTLNPKFRSGDFRSSGRSYDLLDVDNIAL
jgi:hypothetical protein